MDPFTALGLAGSIVQFVDFAWTLVSETQRIASSADGLTAENRLLEGIARDVLEMAQRITAPPGPGSGGPALQGLCEECIAIAGEILDALEALRSSGQQRQWKSFMAAVKQVWKKGRIDRLCNRLAKAQAQVASHIQLMIMSSTSGLGEAIQELRDTNTRLSIETRQDLADLKDRVGLASEALLGGRRSSDSMMQKCLEMLQRQETLQTRTAEDIALQLRQLDRSLPDLKDPKLENACQEFLDTIGTYVDTMRQPPGAAMGLAQDMSVYLQTFSQSVGKLSREQGEGMPFLGMTPIANIEKIVETLRLAELQQQQAAEQASGQLQEFSRSLQTLEQASQTLSSYQAFLGRIYFPEMRSRHRKIEVACSQTFEWILQNPAEIDGESPHHFVEWLQAESRPFWVQGKAGSGKSTLMKFIAGHRRTREHLMAWAAGKRLATAAFYFWNAGSALQKSQEGLLRSLLFEMLRLCPDLIPRVKAAANREGWFGDEDGSWAVEELLAMYRAILSEDIETKFCFFIDGLDEFQDDGHTHWDLIKTLRDLEASPDVKLCLSSRPWTVFGDEFRGDGSWLLRLEDLTRGDIRQVAQDKFTSHPRFRKLRESDREYEPLTGQVVDRSQGVFLWVHLVLRELLQGLTYGDSAQTLQQRLDGFPEDLDHFFQHMLDSIPKVYEARAARMLKIATEAEEELPAMFYSFLEEVEERPERAAEQPIHEVTFEEVKHRVETVRRRLDGRSRGLLEVVGDRLAKTEADWRQGRVGFLHRTVRDFLVGSGTGFLHRGDRGDANAFLLSCKAVLAMTRRLSLTRHEALGDWGDWNDLIRLFFFFGNKSAGRPDTLDCLRTLAAKAEAVYEEASRAHGLGGSRWAFLERACEHDGVFYLEWKLASSSAGPQRAQPWWASAPLGHPDCRALHCALNRGRRPSAVTVDLLLRNGADPNQVCRGCTVWARFLAEALDSAYARRHKEGLFRILHLLVLGGADLDARVLDRVDTKPEQIRGFARARDVLERCLPAEQAAVLLACQPGWFGWIMKCFR